MFNRPSKQLIKKTIIDILKEESSLTIPEIVVMVNNKVGNISTTLQIKQVIWEMIGSNTLKLTKTLSIKLC